jgi:hypothetical protein
VLRTAALTNFSTATGGTTILFGDGPGDGRDVQFDHLHGDRADAD